ncbi:hypothetical protein D3C74_477460 [compost metagenome]
MLAAQGEADEADEFRQIAFLQRDDVEQAVVNPRVGREPLEASDRICIGDQEQHELVVKNVLSVRADD